MEYPLTLLILALYFGSVFAVGMLLDRRRTPKPEEKPPTVPSAKPRISFIEFRNQRHPKT